MPSQPLVIAKAHAYGNDFLFVEEDQLASRDPGELARRACDRHRGIGADGLITFRRNESGAEMKLFNQDGGFAEVSGNGVRCLAALLVRQGGIAGDIRIGSAGGEKTLRLLAREGHRYEFRADMGPPADIRRIELEAGGAALSATVLWMGNPQCVILGPLPDETTFRRLGPALERHVAFPRGTNVEFAHLAAADRLEILIWERGVGPTLSSGTGSCAAAVAAICHAGAARSLEVAAPGGAQRVDWPEGDPVSLTGWAEVVLEGQWIG